MVSYQEIGEVALRGGDGGGHDEGRGRGLEAERTSLVILGQHLDPEPGHEEQRAPGAAGDEVGADQGLDTGVITGFLQNRCTGVLTSTQSAIDLSGMEC